MNDTAPPTAAPSPPNMLDHALAYARMGWHVFPLAPVTPGDDKTGKRPIIPNGHLRATVDEATIRAWWTNYPHAGIGVATAPSGLVVLDVDVAKDKRGAESLEAFQPYLPDTLTASTGSGGLHLVFARGDAEARRTINLPLPGQPKDPAKPSHLDLLGDGYFIVEPSPHYSGGTYRWVNKVPPAPLPEVFKAIQRQSAPPKAVANPEELGAEPIVEGGRNDTLFAMGAGLRDLGFSGDAILSSLWVENNRRFAPPLEESEVRQIVSNVMQRVTPTRDIATGAILSNDFKEAMAAAQVTPPPAVDDGSDGALLVQALHDVQAALSTAPSATTIPGLLFEPAIDVMRRDYPPTPWLIRGLITQEGIGAIVTKPKVGKTWLAQEFALAVATGTPAFGEFDVPQAHPVAYLAAEDIAVTIRNRLRALVAGRGMEVEDALRNLYVQPAGRELDLTRDLDLALLVASVRKIGRLAGAPVKLVVIDPMRNVYSGEEDSSDAVAAFFRRLRVARELLGCSFLLVHHSKKGDVDDSTHAGEEIRGSSAIHGNLAFGLFLRSPGGNGENEFSAQVIAQIKGAKGAGYFGYVLRIDDNEFGEAIKALWEVTRGKVAKDKMSAQSPEADDEMVLKAIRILPAEVRVRSQLVRNCGIRESKARDSLMRLMASGKVKEIRQPYFDSLKRLKHHEVVVLADGWVKEETDGGIGPQGSA
jgi:KaiC/GvpD/RAD55 family RecA-like ATPase